MLPGSLLPSRNSSINDPVLEIIRRARDDRHFTHFLFEIVLFEFAACTKTHKPMVPLNLTVLLMAWNHARSVLSKFDKLASASKEYSRLAQEDPEDAGGENFMSLFELQVATAPFAYSAADLYRYLNDPFRAPLLVARELTVVDLPGMSEDFFALRALTPADHERYWTFYNNLVSPKFHDRYSAIVLGLRELWKDVGTGGWSVTLIGPSSIKGVEKYSRRYNINRVLKEEGLAPLPPITTSPPKAASSSATVSNGKAAPAKVLTPASTSIATTSITAPTKVPAKSPAKTTTTVATTASKGKNSGRPALVDTQVSRDTPSKPAPYSTTTSSKAASTDDGDDLENNEVFFKFVVHEWKKTLDETNTRLTGVRVNTFLDCDYSEKTAKVMEDFSVSQLMNICLFADIFNRMLVRRDDALEKGRQRLIREYSARNPNTKKNAATSTPTATITTTSTTTTITATSSSTELPEVAPSTNTTATVTAPFGHTPSFPNRKIATVRKPKVAPKDAPTVAHQATNRSTTVTTAQTGLKSMQEQEDSDTDSDMPDLLDSDANDDTESDMPDLLDSDDGDYGDDDDSGTDSDLPDLLDSDTDDSGTDSDLPDLLDSDNNDNDNSETDDDLPDLLDSEVEVEAIKSNDKADESSDWETESDLPDLLDSENEKGQETMDVARKHSGSDSDSDLPDLLDSDKPEVSETDSDLPDLLDSEPDDSGSDFDLPDLLDSSEEAEEEEDDDSDYIFSKSDSETGSESSGNASEDEEKDLYGTKLVDTLSDYLIEANLARNTRLWTEKITLRYLNKAQSGISEQELAASRERELAYLYLCDHRFEDPMNALDFEDEEYSPSDEGDGEGDVSTEYSDDGEADIYISESEEDALLKDYNNMDEDGTQSVVSYLECERQQETTHEWSEYYERRLQDPEGSVAQAQHERIERTERVVNERAAIAEEQAKIAREEAEQERLTREKAEKERIAREKAERERFAREMAEQERQEKLARERAERERLAREKEKLTREKVEQERIARQKAEEKERIAQEKAENERLTRLTALMEADQAKMDEKAEHLRREREKAAALEQKTEQFAQEGQERIVQQARENTERFTQESAEQRAREQLAQQQEFQARLRQELNTALEQAEKLGLMVVPSGMGDGATSTQLQPTISAMDASPLTDSQERSRMLADVNEEEDDTRLSAEAPEWPVEEAELVGEAVDSAEVSEQRQPRLNESTKWPNGQQFYYNLRGIDFTLALWRSPGLAFNVMEKEIKEWYPLLIASPEETNIRHLLVQRLQALFDAKFPGQGLIIRPFGSYVTGLGDNNSDVDICVYSDFFQPQAMHSDVSFLASWLQHECQMFEVNAITDAKVPIVKFVDNMTSIHCDLNVQHPLGITNSELIKNYIDIDERLPVFLMLLKYFAKCHSILDASQGYLCSYALILMGIVFFQEQAKPILPRLQSRFTCPKSSKKKSLGAALSEGLVQSRSVLQAGQRFDCTFDTRLAQYKGYGRSNKKPVAQLLYEFFEFFCRRFDYRTMEVNSQMGQFRERNAVARQKKVQLAEERSIGFKTRHTGGNGFVYDGDRHVWMSAEEQTFIMSQEAAGVVPRSARPYPLDHAPEFQDSPSSSSSNSMNGMNGMYGMNGSSNGSGNGGRYYDRFGSEPFLCVMDPFINNRNVAGTCRGEKLAKVWRSFDHAYKCLATGDLDGAFCTPTESKEVWDGLE